MDKNKRPVTVIGPMGKLMTVWIKDDEELKQLKEEWARKFPKYREHLKKVQAIVEGKLSLEEW
jgi:hypothetical protein